MARNLDILRCDFHFSLHKHVSRTPVAENRGHGSHAPYHRLLRGPDSFGLSGTT